AVNTGDADIVEMLDVVAHDLGGGDRLFGDRNVAGAGGDDGDGALAVLFFVAAQDGGAGQRAVLGGACLLLDGGELLLVDAGGEHVGFLAGQPGENFSDLARSFAFAQDDFRHTDAQQAM